MSPSPREERAGGGQSPSLAQQCSLLSLALSFLRAGEGGRELSARLQPEQCDQRAFHSAGKVYFAALFSKGVGDQRPWASPVVYVFDVHEQGIIDSTFGILPPGWNSPLRWWDLPADRHNQGCDLAFADGHAEHWRWAAPKIFEKVGQDIRDAGDIKDFRRVQAGVRPETRF